MLDGQPQCVGYFASSVGYQLSDEHTYYEKLWCITESPPLNLAPPPLQNGQYPLNLAPPQLQNGQYPLNLAPPPLQNGQYLLNLLFVVAIIGERYTWACCYM